MFTVLKNVSPKDSGAAETIRGLGSIDKKRRTGERLWDAKLIEVVRSNMQGLILSSTVWYSKHQKFFCEDDSLKPRGARIFLQNLDCVNDFYW